MRGVLLLFLLALLISCDNFGTLSDEEYVTRAQELLDKGELNSASIELKNALSQNPNNTLARWLLGNTYLELGNGPAAEKELRRAHELGMADEAIIIPLGNSLLLQGKFSSVISEIQPLGSSSEELARIHALRGNAFLGEGKLEDAATELQSAINLSGDLTEAQIAYARLEMARGKRKEARNWIDTSLASAPESADAWSLLGNIELAEVNATEAETAFSNAIKYRKYTTVDTAKRALVRIQLDRYSDAEADIQKLEQQGFKDHPYVNYVKGINYFRQEKYSEALEAFKAVDAQVPSYLPLNLYLATTNYILGNQEQAQSYAKQMHISSPRSLHVTRLLGAIDISRSEYDAATKILLAALRTSPDDAVILDMLGKVSLLEGNTAKGVEYYQRLVLVTPESREAKNRLSMAKIMDGQALDKDIVDDQVQTSPKSDFYTRDFLFAVEAFRDGKLGEALEQATKLHEQYPEKVAPLNLVAASYLAAGQWDRAKVELEKVLSLKPNEPSATRNLAIVEIEEGSLEQARARLKELVKEYPQDEKAILLLIGTEARLGNQAAAMQILEQAVERNPKALQLRANLAAQYLITGQVAKVLEVTRDLSDKQLQQQPNLFELRGKAQMRMGNLDSARRSFQHWTEAAPDSSPAHFLYSDSLARSGKSDRARELLKRAIELDPGYVPARVEEIKLLVHDGEIDSARNALTKLKLESGPSPAVLGLEGWFALGNGDFATAADLFTAAMKQKPDTELTILLVRALWAQQKQVEAIKVMQSWLKDYPQDLAVLLQLAESYLSLNREEDAAATYTKVVEFYPNHLISLNNLAWFSRDKDLEQAIAYAERAYDVAGDEPNVLDTYGMLLLRKGDVERGYRMIQKAAERSPETPVIQLHLGRALVLKKQYDDAQQVLSVLMEKAPDSASANEARVLLESIPKQ